MSAESTFEVDFKPRPKVELVQTVSIKKDQKVYRHQGFCAGEEDQVALRFDGMFLLGTTLKLKELIEKPHKP